MKCNATLVFADFTSSDRLEKRLSIHVKLWGIFNLSHSTYVIWIPLKTLLKLRTEITSPIVKSTSRGRSDTTFFTRCSVVLVNSIAIQNLFCFLGRMVTSSWVCFQLAHSKVLFVSDLLTNRWVVFLLALCTVVHSYSLHYHFGK